MRQNISVVAALFFAGVVAAFSQQTQVPGAFRTAITLVPIDVRVLDRDNRPITDLNQGDFTILEDGVPQEIQHFLRHALVPETASPDTRLQLRQPPTSSLSPQNRRVFLIVLGRGRLGQPPEGGLDALIQFVRKGLLPQDHVAVTAYNKATDFTTDHDKVAQVLERFQRAHYGIDMLLMQRFSGLAAVYGNRNIPPSIQEQIDGIFRTTGGLGARTLPPAQSVDTARRQDDVRRTADATQRTEIVGNRAIKSPFDQATLAEDARYTGDPDLTFDAYVSKNAQTMQDLSGLYAGIEYLRYFEGEKHLIFVTSHGLLLPRVEDDKSIAAIANDARVVIDAIVAGVPSPAPRLENLGTLGRSQPGAVPGRTTTDTFAVSSLDHVSELTGGRLFQFMYSRQALDRINAATMSGYVLGYYPADSASDGRYRRISVKVSRPDVTVLFRHGYYSRQVLVPLDRRAFVTYSRIAAAGTYPEPVRDIGVTLKVVRVEGGAGKPLAVEVNANISVPRACFQATDDWQVAHLDVSIFCGDSQENLVGELWQTVDFKLTAESYERAMKDGLPHTARVTLKAPARWVKVVVYEPTADIVGSAVTRVR